MHARAACRFVHKVFPLHLSQSTAITFNTQQPAEERKKERKDRERSEIVVRNSASMKKPTTIPITSYVCVNLQAESVYIQCLSQSGKIYMNDPRFPPWKLVVVMIIDSFSGSIEEEKTAHMLHPCVENTVFMIYRYTFFNFNPPDMIKEVNQQRSCVTRSLPVGHCAYTSTFVNL